MSPRTPGRSGRRALFAIPAVAVPAAVVAAVVLIPTQAIGAVDLPDKTPKELIEFVESSDVDQLSGTIEQTSELGIPDLGALTGATGGDDSDASGAAAADLDDLITLVTGSYTANVYLDGDRGRLQVLDRLAERNVYVDGEADVAWFVDSESKTATKLIAPDAAAVEQLKQDAEAGADGAEAQARERYEAETGQPLPTPEAMLDQALASLDETTEVTVGTDGRVAGRDVYELVLEPRTDDTLVGSIRFAVDGENGAALSASVTARGADEPAFRVAFTEVSFAAPDAASLTFEPGAGITVAEKQIEIPTAEELAAWRAQAEAKAGESEATAGGASPTVYGEGWSAVVELPATAEEGSMLDGLTAEQQQMLDSVTTPVDGGRVFATSLATVLIADDGRVLAGAVTADRLVEAAASGR